VRTAQTALIHLLLEAAGLAPSRVNASQALGKGPFAPLTVETATGEVQEHSPWPQIQIANTARLVFMNTVRDRLAAGANGNPVTMFAVQMENVFLTSLLNLKVGRRKLRQPQQRIQRLCGDALCLCPKGSPRRAGCISYPVDGRWK